MMGDKCCQAFRYDHRHSPSTSISASKFAPPPQQISAPTSREHHQHKRRSVSSSQLTAQLTLANMANILQIVILCFSTFTLLPPSTAQVDRFAHGAVVRPTIFSGLPKDSPTDSQISPLLPQQKNNQQHQPPNQDGASTTQKINPLKSRFCTGPNGQRLDHALGLQSFAIDNLSLSASSFSNEQVRPHLARLNQDNLGGAWCPRRPISAADFGKEWIQVKLNRSFVVTAIETQGRFALGSGKEFVPNYQVEYSRNNGLTWHKWKDFRGSSLLKANEDVHTAVRNEFSPPIVGANVIRILPYSVHLRTVCMRFELYGCQYDEGAPISYTSNDGVVEPRWGHLIDYTYDGVRHKNGQLIGGLGQLVDGVKGPDNFLHNTGFEWVGWKSNGGDVVIEFTFKTLRNFTGALFYSNNLFSSGVEVFQAVDVHYGIDINLSTEALKDSLSEQRRRSQTDGAVDQSGAGAALSRAARQLTGSEEQAPSSLHSTVWSTDVLSIEYEPDKKVESSRPVTVHLRQRLANKLRFVLKFASKWILISEVEFLSYPVELMSLASLNEQLTPKLMVDLQQQAKTYDQYVAILREHQLRRIAADEYLNMGGVSTTTSAAGPVSGTSDSTSETPPVAIVSGPATVDRQQAEQTPAGSDSNNKVIVATDPDGLMDDSYNQMMLANSNSNNNNNNKQQRNTATATGQWLPNGLSDSLSPTLMNTQFLNGLPATNPLLNNQPPFSDSINNIQQIQPSLIFDKFNSNSNGATNDLLAQQQQQQSRTRTVGLATVISFVFVGIIAFLGTLFAVSSYRLRQAHPKLSSPTTLPHHFVEAVSGNKGFITGVFASSSPSATAAAAANSTGSSTASGCDANTMNYRHHDHMAPPRNLMGAAQLSDQHYNPLFAASSGRSSEGSLKKSSAGTGPLSTLKRLAQLTTSGASGTSAKKHRHQQQQHTLANANLLFSSAVRHQSEPNQASGPHRYQHQNQLLVSLKDSISSNGKVPNSQTVNTQLIVGLNQANPLAHQQIYNNANSQIYNNQHQPMANYSVTTNSMSLASSSTTGNANGQHNHGGGGGDYSLAPSSTGGDYATPDIQPIIQSSSTNLINPASTESQHFMAQHKFPLVSTADHMRHSRRFNQTLNRTMHHQQQQQQQQIEHNYEQIASDHQQQQQPQGARLSGAGTMMLHNRTFSNQQQQQPQACLMNSMTIGQSNVIDGRTTRQH